ncbi:hypothetical protein GALL_166120 [mine drainage metagenome]|uniref:Uncharacterized protein n=1 Tax=mine drainage metagenome TaxID=410659 RepID=A0A1J5SI05_9ZZZZ
MNVSPHISVNKLGEYIFATPAKKRSILKTIKFPSTFKNARYPEPKSAFLHFMADSTHNKETFEQKRHQLLTKAAVSDWEKNKRKCCLEAIDHLIACSETILVPYLKYVAEKGLSNTDYDTEIGGVTLHLKPDTLLVDKKTKKITGFFKLIFSKSRNVEWNEATISAGAIRNHVEKTFVIKLKPENCLVIDVFNRRKHNAPKFLQINKVHVKMACAEIADIWPTINKN